MLRDSITADVPSSPSDADVTAWLLTSDPAIRWQTMRDLLDEPAERYEVERSLVSTTGWCRRLLDHQDSDGTWGGGLYSPKWRSTTYTLLLLWRFGLDPTNAQARRGIERLWEGARFFDGGLTCAATIDAPEACVTSMYLTLAFSFGIGDARVDGALDWLLANQLADGGWNCRTVRFGDRHSSFHTSILALEALTAVHPEHPRRPEVDVALSAGQGFFLAHRLYRSHRDGSVGGVTGRGRFRTPIEAGFGSTWNGPEGRAGGTRCGHYGSDVGRRGVWCDGQVGPACAGGPSRPLR